MRGDPDSCGVWAPCLTHADGLFWLIYTDVKRYGRTTVGRRLGGVAARLPQLPRHEPRHRRRVVGPRLPQQQRLRSLAVPRRRRAQVPRQPALGPPARPQPLRRHRAPGVLGRGATARRRAARTSSRARPSASPRRRTSTSANGYYYLLTAEGGTGWGHAVTMARVASADRALRAPPRRLHPERAPPARRRRCSAPGMPTSWRRRAARPTWSTSAAGRCRNRGRCTLGRETAIAAHGVGRRTAGCARPTAQGLPSVEVAGARAARPPASRRRPCARTSTTRPCPSTSSGCARPIPTRSSASPRVPGTCGSIGRETIGSLFRQSLVARRQQAHCYSARTRDGVRARALPAGRRARLLLRRRRSSTTSTSRTTRRWASTCASCRRSPTQAQADAFTPPVPIPSGPRRAARRGRPRAAALRLPRRAAARGTGCPQQFDASILSDEATAPGAPELHRRLRGHGLPGHWPGTAHPADFDWFEYRERAFAADPRA